MQVDYVSVYAARRHWGSCILVSRAIKRQELVRLSGAAFGSRFVQPRGTGAEI
jgi:hypothetical protein